MTYDEALRYLASIEGLGIKLALQNITQVLSALDDPQRKYPSVLISGTNGKGSVAAALASILRRSGRRTGLYTSPHLIRHEERIVVDGRSVTPQAFAGAVGRVHDVVRTLLGTGALQAHPTHFETITAAAFHHFAVEGLDIAVLEVGMGGRLDATVLARPRLSIITNVDLEHTAFLGETIAAIAAEKAGILPEGGTLLTGETQAEAIEAFRRRAAESGGRLIELRDFARVERHGGGRLTVRTPRRLHENLEMGLRGPYQSANAALAVAACDLLQEMGFSVPEEAVRTGLAETRWPGRFQIVEGAPRIVLDGAHNPAACRALREALLDLARGSVSGTTLLFGVLRDKDHAGMMAALFPAASRVVLTRGRSERFREPHALLEAARDMGAGAVLPGSRSPEKGTREAIAPAGAPVVLVTESVEEGLREARGITPPDGMICVCGSLYLVSDAMRTLGIEPWPSSPQDRDR